MRHEFSELLNLKTVQGISYFIVCPWSMMNPNKKITVHGNKYQRMRQIHDPWAFGMT